MMKDYAAILSRSEKAIYDLRDLYRRHGYRLFRTGKFEDYQLYSKNRDFLGKDGIITFTDNRGRIMALKPDVTLSIAKNSQYAPDTVERYCYDDQVYRMSRGKGDFREIDQTGVECIGDLTEDHVLEVIQLAVKSLEAISDDYVLTISHMGIVRGFISILGLSEDAEEKVLRAVGNKNFHTAAAVCAGEGVSRFMINKLEELIATSGTMDQVLGSIEDLAMNQEMEKAARELRRIQEALDSKGLAKAGAIRFDFSMVNDMGYYNGVIFQGFVRGVPYAVLSGGRYDNLMEKMGRKGGAIGFSVDISALEENSQEAGGAAACEGASDGTGAATAGAENDSRDTGGVPAVEGTSAGTGSAAEGRQMINVALPKGRLGEKVYSMFAVAGYEAPELLDPGRKLIFTNEEAGVSFFWVKPSDVAIYVERGAADVGVVGKDILLEGGSDVYELLDLGIGKCRMMVAGPKDWEDNTDRTLRVATKFPRIASKYYTDRSRDIDIIKLNGSIEIAPILGLSDVIVDIVETGNTLRANDLEPKEKIVDISARFIANKAIYNFKSGEIGRIVSALSAAVPEAGNPETQKAQKE